MKINAVTGSNSLCNRSAFKFVVVTLWGTLLKLGQAENGRSASQNQSQHCHYDISAQWTAEIGTTPIIAPPLLYDIDGDAQLELITITYSDSVNIVDIATGMSRPGWPITIGDATFHSGPLLFDVDQDGKMEVMLVSTGGTIYFLQTDGDLMLDRRYQLPSLPVLRNWHEKYISVDRNEIADVLLLDRGI